MDIEDYMRRAIELARRGEGLVNPNPLVGCVVVKDDRIVAEGWHEHYGGFHAERNALLSCTEDVRGASLYVTLEPCCHTGKTPPCTDIIIERGIGTVYIGSDDPNPLVAGHGIELLRAAGIEVVTHVLKEECDALNEIFFHYITAKRPFVAMKYAMTLDGKIGLAGGHTAGDTAGHTAGDAPGAAGALLSAEDRKITGVEALKHVHGLRRRYASILVGINTILSDDPMLNVRDTTDVDPRVHPIRIILDSHLRTPLTAKVVTTARDIPTIIAYVDPSQSNTGDSPDKAHENRLSTKIERLTHVGVQLWPLPADPTPASDRSIDSSGQYPCKHVSIPALLDRMAAENIDSVLVEGGSAVHGAFFEHREYVNRIYAYLAPKLIGGSSALSPVGGVGVPHMADALTLQNTEILPLGEELLITGTP